MSEFNFLCDTAFKFCLHGEIKNQYFPMNKRASGMVAIMNITSHHEASLPLWKTKRRLFPWGLRQLVRKMKKPIMIFLYISNLKKKKNTICSYRRVISPNLGCNDERALPHRTDHQQPIGAKIHRDVHQPLWQHQLYREFKV